MAASRLVMADFFERYQDILLRADLKITLMKVYVDDGRQVTSLLKQGMRFNPSSNSFEWSKEAEEEDKMMEEMGEEGQVHGKAMPACHEQCERGFNLQG